MNRDEQLALMPARAKATIDTEQRHRARAILRRRHPPLRRTEVASALLTTLALTLVVLCGCTPPRSVAGVSTPTLVGGAGGGAVGGLLASGLSHGNPVLTAAGALGGTLLGALIGHLVAPPPDALHQAMQAPTGTKVPWASETGQSAGTITAGTWRPLPSGGQCRSFTMAVVIDGRAQTVEGCAVPRPDGTWEVQR